MINCNKIKEIIMTNKQAITFSKRMDAMDFDQLVAVLTRVLTLIIELPKEKG